MYNELHYSGLQSSVQAEFEEVINEGSKAFIHTEGKTDWKHLKKAKENLQVDLRIEFSESEDSRGDSDLLKMCKYFSEVSQKEKMIFIFDADNSDIIKKLDAKTKNGEAFQEWGNNVYSFYLPTPSHRNDCKEVCLELFYQDIEIKTKDENGRRLFLNREFNKESGRHISLNFNCRNINVLKSESTKIIDDNVFDSTNQNIALSKDNFAKNVLEGVSGFDNFNFSEFPKIFEIIKSIMLKL